MNHKEYSSRAEFDERVDSVLREYSVGQICMAGFMRVLGGSFVRRWEGRLLNIHPALLPAFRGAHAHRDVLAANAPVTGATVHFVAVLPFLFPFLSYIPFLHGFRAAFSPECMTSLLLVLFIINLMDISSVSF